MLAFCGNWILDWKMVQLDDYHISQCADTCISVCVTSLLFSRNLIEAAVSHFLSAYNFDFSEIIILETYVIEIIRFRVLEYAFLAFDHLTTVLNY